MTLQELLRVHTREAHDALQSCEDKIRDLGSERRAELNQTEALQAEIDSKRGDEEQKRHSLEDSAAKIRDLERQIEDLRLERDQLAEQSQRLTRVVMDVENEVNAVFERRKKAKTRADNLEHQIKELVVEKERYHNRLRLGYRTAFNAYLDDLGTRLAREIAVHEERSEKVASRKKLEQARHENTEIMNLYEARTELQKLLKVSNVAAVREQLGQQLRDVESQIEALFPGALAVESRSEGTSQIEEIFFLLNDDGSTHIFLPISSRTWKALADGDLSAPASCALRLVWGLARGLGVTGSNARLKTRGDFVQLEVALDLDLTADSVDISMPLPGSGTVAFLLSKLPREVQEAIQHENSNK